MKNNYLLGTTVIITINYKNKNYLSPNVSSIKKMLTN